METLPECTQGHRRLWTATRRAGSALRLLACLLAIGATSPPRADDSLRCGSRIVSIGAFAPAVRAACGEPSYRESWRYDDASYAQYVGDTEAWTYDFGPNQLLRVLRFRNDRLTRIEHDGYGLRQPLPQRCGPNDIVERYSAYRLVALCGEPAGRRALGYLVPYRVPEAYGDAGGIASTPLLAPSFREEWTYNFGARYLLRRVILENGRVVEIVDGERGYDPP